MAAQGQILESCKEQVVKISSTYPIELAPFIEEINKNFLLTLNA